MRNISVLVNLLGFFSGIFFQQSRVTYHHSPFFFQLFDFFVQIRQFSENGISRWFQESILDIENTVLIGFVFKVIGFFFLIGMFFKMLNALNYIISGRPLVNVKTGFSSKKKSSDDSFDDFEEIDDNKLSE